jgi:hypothetical protein
MGKPSCGGSLAIKRWFQDAGAIALSLRTSARFWSAPVLRRFWVVRSNFERSQPYFIVSPPRKSGTGAPHSKPLARLPWSNKVPPGFGVRRSCGAFGWCARISNDLSIISSCRASGKAGQGPRTPSRWRDCVGPTKFRQVLEGVCRCVGLLHPTQTGLLNKSFG